MVSSIKDKQERINTINKFIINRIESGYIKDNNGKLYSIKK